MLTNFVYNITKKIIENGNLKKYILIYKTTRIIMSAENKKH